MPLSWYVSHSWRAVTANVLRLVGSAATAAKFSLPLPPPPIDKITFRCGCWLFKATQARRQPFVPSTSILSSAQSSLSCIK